MSKALFAFMVCLSHFEANLMCFFHQDTAESLIWHHPSSVAGALPALCVVGASPPGKIHKSTTMKSSLWIWPAVASRQPPCVAPRTMVSHVSHWWIHHKGRIFTSGQQAKCATASTIRLSLRAASRSATSKALKHLARALTPNESLELASQNSWDISGNYTFEMLERWMPFPMSSKWSSKISETLTVLFCKFNKRWYRRSTNVVLSPW